MKPYLSKIFRVVQSQNLLMEHSFLLSKMNMADLSSPVFYVPFPKTPMSRPSIYMFNTSTISTLKPAVT